ncbi:Altered inheritance of mitochondria protein 32-like protein [Drosera capensis]
MNVPCNNSSYQDNTSTTPQTSPQGWSPNPPPSPHHRNLRIRRIRRIRQFLRPSASFTSMSITSLDPLTFTHTSSSSSPITLSDHLDSAAGIGSASSSFQGESVLGSDGGGEGEFGFGRSEFRGTELVGTVKWYERHVFLCYKGPRNWPPRIEAAEFDRLPRLLAAAVAARKGGMRKETRLTICEGRDGTETSNGDVLIFPDMIRYRRLTHFDVDTFVEEVFVKDGEWLPGTPEKLKGSHIFVCCHGSRDRRSGVCGPPIVAAFKEKIASRGLQGKVSVSPCSHIGGHKYAGNVIIFGLNINQQVTGHWYGYVAPEDVPLLLEQHIIKGEIVEHLWRGQMGLSEDDQRKAQEVRLRRRGEIDMDRIIRQPSLPNAIYSPAPDESHPASQANGSDTLSPKLSEESGFARSRMEAMPTTETKSRKQLSRNNSYKGPGAQKVCGMPTWLECWEREDTYAALAVVCAAVSVGVAFSFYKQLALNT